MSADPPWVPDPTELATDLRELRSLLDQGMPRLTQIKELVRTAQLLSPMSTDDLDSVRAVVQLAIDHLPRDGRPAVAVLLYGLTKDSAGRRLTDRRELAYARHVELAREPYKKTTFRTGFEKKLATDLATALVELVVAHNEHPVLTGEDDQALQPPEAETTPNVVDSDQATAADAQAETWEQPPQDDEHGVVAPDEQSAEPVEALPQPNLEPAGRRRWDAGRRFLRRHVAVLLTVAGVTTIGAAIVLVSDYGNGRSAGRAVSEACGPTTVQLFTNPAQQILVYAPGSERAEHGWVGVFPQTHAESPEKTETFRYGEVRQFAMQSTNETSATEHNLIARIGLTQSAKLEPNTTCVYRPTSYTRGTHYAGTGLIAPGGFKIGSLAPHEKVDVTFKEQLPTVGRSGNIAKTYGAIAPESKIGGPNWIEEHSALVELELIGGA
jgi:hypothetical protein